MNNFDDIYANNVSSQKILSTHYNSFYFDVLNGLSKKNKKIPYKYLYDKNGVRLFNEICRQKEYYQTRTELHILKNNVKDILSKTKKKESLLYLGGCTVLKAEHFLKINKNCWFTAVFTNFSPRSSSLILLCWDDFWQGFAVSERKIENGQNLTLIGPFSELRRSCASKF